MKKILLVLFVLLGIAQLWAQDWKPTWEAALQEAQTLERPILLVFSGSDWCAPCIKLDRDIWSTTAFKAFAKESLVAYQADFPRRKANQLPAPLASQNKTLAATYNPNGYFPLVVLTDKNGVVLGQTGYLNITPDLYIEKLKGFYEK